MMHTPRPSLPLLRFSVAPKSRKSFARARALGTMVPFVTEPAARSMSHEAPTRPPSWKWMVCGMLLCATMLNYMDRLTLNQTSTRVMAEFRLDEEGYGLIETVFSVAFGL